MDKQTKPFILPDEGDNVIRTTDVCYAEEFCCVGKLFFEKMKNHKDAIAQIDAETGKFDTYGDLLKKSARVAIEMRARGVKPDDVVLFCTLNEREAYTAYIAGLFVGAVVCSIHPLLPPEDIAYLLSQVSPSMIVCVPQMKEPMEKMIASGANARCDVVVLDGDERERNSIGYFLFAKEGEDEFEPHIVEDTTKTAAIFFSSGTTGRPKGICLSHKLLVNKVMVFVDMGYNTEVILTFATLYWISTLNILTSTVFMGTTRVLASKYHPLEAMKIVEKYKVTFLFAAIVHVKMYVNFVKKGSVNLPHLSIICTAGAYANDDLFRKLRDIFPKVNVCVFFAMTEVAGPLLGFRNNDEEDLVLMKRKPSSCGRPIPGNSYKIIDTDTGKAVGPNKYGELRVKSDYQLNGYYKTDSSTAWDSDGWLKTGDILFYDEDYCFHFVDRLKDMIRYHLWQVPTGILIDLLEQHPAVRQAVVIGIPHETDGEHPLGVVILKENCTVSEEELRKFVDDRVDDVKKLRGGVRFVKNIPMTPTGKIKKIELKQMLGIKN